MKITFDDGSYLELIKSENNDKVTIIISAKDFDNFKKKITNSAEISIQQFKELIISLGIS